MLQQTSSYLANRKYLAAVSGTDGRDSASWCSDKAATNRFHHQTTLTEICLLRDAWVDNMHQSEKRNFFAVREEWKAHHFYTVERKWVPLYADCSSSSRNAAAGMLSCLSSVEECLVIINICQTFGVNICRQIPDCILKATDHTRHVLKWIKNQI